MHATHQFFLTKRSLYILVLDARQDEQQSRIVLVKTDSKLWQQLPYHHCHQQN